MKKLIKYSLIVLVSIIVLLILIGIAQLTMHVYYQMGLKVTIVLLIGITIFTVMALGIISGLIVDSIMKNYEDPYGN